MVSTTNDIEGDTAVVSGAHDPARDIGSNVGRYVVLEEIGHGAMGRVRRAYDPKLQREVALKSVRREALGHEGARRMVAEARAMAKLSHPNVVAVYDVEELDAAAVVLVMEYVAGQTLTAWLAGERSWQEIVAHFRRAGRGLAAAHAASLLHRDFKPDNVLVAEHDVVKVTDFGLAKIAGEDTLSVSGEAHGSGSEHLTATGLVLGTPRYMAPEQHRGEPLTPAADQYAYCVALFEALTRVRAFDGTDLVQAKMQGAPAWPGGPTPRAIVDAIRRGLAPDPMQRWPDMDALLHALLHDPKRARRRWLYPITGLGVVALGAAGVYASAAARAQRCTETAAAAHLQGAWDDDRRARVRDAILGVNATYASDVSTHTEHTLDAYAAAWTQMHVDACEATTVRGEQSEAVLDLRMACLRRASMELSAVTEVLASADAQTVQKAHDLTATLRPLARCEDVDALQADVEPPLPEEAEVVETIRSHLAASKAARVAGKYPEAHAHVQAAAASLDDVSYEPVRIEIVLEDGIVQWFLGHYEDAEGRLRESLRMSARARHWDGMLDASTSLLSVVGYMQRRFDEVSSYAELARGLSATDPVREARVCNNLALGLGAQARYEEAEKEQRRAIALREEILGSDHPDLLSARLNLANIFDAQGRLDEAEREHRRALATLIDTLGADHPRTAQAHHNLAITLNGQKRYAEAEAQARRALAIKEAALPPDHPELGISIDTLATTLYPQEELAEAEALHRRALEIAEKGIGKEHPRVAASLANLALVVQASGRLDEAEALQRRALAIREKLLPPDHPDIASSHNNLASTLRAAKRYDEAVAELRRALPIYEKALGTDHPRVAAARRDLADVESLASPTPKR
jgi:tetratricopeptide (TPR) repeat protein/tRNA A-37 threonylcarbamoyl transferase component Bud32